MKLRYVLVLVMFFVFVHGAFGASGVLISSTYPYQGEIVVLKFVDPVKIPDSVAFNGTTVPFFKYGDGFRAIIPIGPTKTLGAYTLTVHFTSGENYSATITVRKKAFPVVVLGIPEELGLTPTGLVTKLADEKENLNKVLTVTVPEIYFSRTFGLPLRDNRRIGSVFGEIRKTGNQEIRHLGVDLTAPRGAAVGAINGGVVRKAYLDTVYGNTVVLDHGQGIFSLYLHLDSIAVKVGDKLRQGALIGRVGSTGYAEAPHLHLSMKINGVSVDPLAFVRAFR